MKRIKCKIRYSLRRLSDMQTYRYGC